MCASTQGRILQKQRHRDAAGPRVPGRERVLHTPVSADGLAHEEGKKEEEKAVEQDLGSSRFPCSPGLQMQH